MRSARGLAATAYLLVGLAFAINAHAGNWLKDIQDATDAVKEASATVKEAKAAVSEAKTTVGSLESESAQPDCAQMRVDILEGRSRGPGNELARLERSYADACGELLPSMVVPAVSAPPPLPQDESRWHVAVDGEQLGPYTSREVSQHIGSGRVDRETLVWMEGMVAWQPAGQTPALSAYFARMPPPLPPR